MATFELTLRFAAIALLAVIACVAFRDLRPGWSGKAIAVFCFGIGSYLICPLVAQRWQLGAVELVFFFGCFGNPVFFLLLSRGVFEDRFRPRPAHLCLLAAIEAAGFWHRYEQDIGPLVSWFNTIEASRIAYQFPALAIIVWALVRAYRGRDVDLVEPRRRFRDLFVGVSGGYMILVVAAEILLRDETAKPELELLNVAAIFTLTFVVAVFALKFPAGVFPVARVSRTARDERSPAEQQLLDDLAVHMNEGGYREPGLSIGGLARELGTAEHTLRRLINQDLGYRNFTEFLNNYRINDARTRLVAPETRRLPVLTIAMDVGYASLGPFNRAFKETTGMTPTAFRAAHGADPSDDA